LLGKVTKKATPYGQTGFTPRLATSKKQIEKFNKLLGI